MSRHQVQKALPHTSPPARRGRPSPHAPTLGAYGASILVPSALAPSVEKS